MWKSALFQAKFLNLVLLIFEIFENGIAKLQDRLNVHQKLKLENIDLNIFEKVVEIFKKNMDLI